MLRKKAKSIIVTQVVVIASLVIAIQSVGMLSNAINDTANKFTTTDYSVSLIK